MKQAALPKMTVDEFLVWAERQPEGKYELFDGEVVRQSHDGVSMQAERVAHTEVKGNVFAALRGAIAAANAPCRALVDGSLVKITDTYAFLPDILVYCGERANRASMKIDNPLIVVEVLSEGTAKRDMGHKLAGYLTVSSLRHYILIDPDKPLVIHHSRHDHESGFQTRVVASGTLHLDPPGLSVEISDFFV